MYKPTTFYIISPCRIEAIMYFPEDMEQQEAWFYTRERELIIAAIEKRNQWPTPITLDDFLALAQDTRKAPPPEEIDKRRAQGWMLGIAFDYLIRAELLHPGNPLGKRRGKLATRKKVLVHLERVAQRDENVPGCDREQPSGGVLFDEARARMWSAAHYWASEFRLDGSPRFPDAQRTPIQWEEFMQLAETYRKLGLAAGAFKTLAPENGFDPDLVYYDSQFGGFPMLGMPHLSEAELKHLDSYVSKTTISRRRKRAAAKK